MKCIVPNCCSESSRSARSEGITFHKFPTDKDALAAWQKSLGLTSCKPFENNVICSEHFHERDFCVTNDGLRKLHDDAFPVNLVCRVCFIMDSKMKDIQKYYTSFEDVTGIPFEEGDWLPQQICWQCAAQLRTAANFRAKALLSDGLLHDLLNRETDLKFRALMPMRRVLKECGFESKLKQVTFDIEHFDTYILDSSVDTQLKHNEQNYLDNDLHVIIDKSVMKNNDNDNIIDENVTENNDISNDINTPEIEEHDETEFSDMNEYATSNTGKEINSASKKTIHNTMDDIEINSDSNNVVNNTIDDKKPDSNTEYYMGIQGFENNNASNDTHAYKPCQSNECPEAFDISQNQPVTSNILLHSNVEHSVPFKYSNERRQYPTIDISHFQPVLKSISNSSDHVKTTVPPKKEKVKKAGNIDFKYARKLLKRLGHIKDPPPVKKRKKIETKQRGPKEKDVESYSIKNGEITVHYIRNTTDCEIPADVSQLESHFTITPLTQDRLLQEIERRKEKAEYTFYPYKCGECYQSFPDEERYNLHMIKHDKRSGLHQCGICKIVMKAGYLLRDHMKLAHSFEFECIQCSWKSRDRYKAREHIKFHEGQTYICPYCSKIFGKSTSRLNHIRIKHPSDFVCELCGYSFIGAKGLELHKRLRHRLDNLQVPEDGPLCELCHVRFVSSEAHKRHLRVSARHHTGTDKDSRESNETKPPKLVKSKDWREMERRPRYKDWEEDKRMKVKGPIPCEQCGIQLKDTKEYHYHFRRMHPDKNRTNYPFMKSPCMCEVCGKMFQTYAVFKYHMRGHTGERPFKCEDCGKAFRLKQSLIEHRRVHSQVRKSYVCPQCGKQFTTAGNRQRHMFVHTGVKPLKCEICGLGFVYASEKRVHVEYVHLKKPWPKRVRGKRRPVTRQGQLPKKGSDMDISTPMSPACDPKLNEMDGMMEE